MTRALKPVQMACLTIGFESYLIPSDKAMKVAELMQSAFECRRDFDRGHTYMPGEQPRVEFTLVKANELRKPADSAARQIGYEGSRS